MRDRPTRFFQRIERAGVEGAVPDDLPGQVIAALFAGKANLRRKPPDRRVEKQGGFDADLHHVQQDIVPGEMGQFMGDQRLGLRRGQARQGSQGQQDARAQQPEGAGNVYLRRAAQDDGPAQPHPGGEPLGAGRPLRRAGRACRPAQPVQPEQAAEMTQAERADAQRPAADQQREQRLPAQERPRSRPRGRADRGDPPPGRALPLRRRQALWGLTPPRRGSRTCRARRRTG